MIKKRQDYDGIAVCAPVTIPYSRYSLRSAQWFCGKSIAELIRSAKIEKNDIDGFCISSFTLAPDSAVGLMQHAGVSPRWLDHIPMGGASGVVALRRAARAVQAGDAEIIACVGADTNHVDTFRNTIATFSQFANDAVYPYGSGGPNSSFAFLTDYYMREFGNSREDFGKLCIAQRDNALPVAHAMMKKPLTMEEYLNARLIADPIRLFDCVMPCAGAEAFLVMSEERARSLDIPYTTILSTIERHNAFPDDPIQFRGGWALDIDEFYDQAGIGPKDIDFLQAYDDYPVICFMQIEDLGFCKKGDASKFIDDKDLTTNGDFPINTSGGQLSAGQAGAGGGYLGVVETIRQLTEQTIGHQVEKAQHGLVSCFGMINYDRGLCTSAAILARA
ncbi:MAG: thiolase family protein [Pseudomonadota bacterium]|nr:thiolase family protein [Pseudomonadota bacterium]